MILGMTYYQIAMYFLVYSFGGWCLEVVYHALKVGKIINRGFLNGPVCPVYGFGMLAVCAMIHFLPQDQGTGEYNVAAVFFGGMILATVIEFIAGFLLYHIFHARWWDYSNLPFNIGGYICPLYSVLWGLACVIVVRYVHPLITGSVSGGIPEKYGWPLMAVLYALYLADLIVTVLTASGLNRELDELDKIREAMRRPSDKMSSLIGESTIQVAQKMDEGRVQAALGRAEAGDAMRRQRAAYEARREELRRDLMEHPHFGKTRLLKAFPEMKHREHEELVRELQKRIREGKKIAAHAG